MSLDSRLQPQCGKERHLRVGGHAAGGTRLSGHYHERTVHGCEVPIKQPECALTAQSWLASLCMSSLVCSFCGHISLT